MRPGAALGHVAGKLAVVLDGMLKSMTPYDESKHRRDLGLVQVDSGSASTPVDVPLDVVDVVDAPNDLVVERPIGSEELRLSL